MKQEEKMNKTRILKSICLFFMAFLVAAPVGCAQKDQSRPVTAEIWTMPSTVKVLRDEDYSENYTDTPQLTFETARNEYESAQLFITPETDVKNYTVTVSDLTDAGGNTIAKENITVYNQKYVEIVSLTSKTSGRPLGYYPDALIPMQAAESAGETTIKAGANQGIWLTLFTPENTKSGTYFGSVTLKVDDSTFQVPITVTVWDFVVPNKSNIRTAFYIFPEYLMGGELNNTPEMYQKYVDTCLDYRISTTFMVYPLSISEDDWLAKIKEYAANERCTSYVLSNEMPFSEERQLRLLIENSTPDLNLVEKAYFYPYDEPYGDTVAPAVQKNKDLIDMLIAVASSYSTEQLTSFGLTKADIESIPVLITAITTIDGLRTYCPPVQEFNTPALREKYAKYREEAYAGKNGELRENAYGSTWWYHCGISQYQQHPTLVIDGDLLSCRVQSWMQYEYGLDGFLYWGSASYFNTDNFRDNINGWRPAKLWDVGNSVVNQANGDGMLLYPGAKYGLDEPIPSIRLMSLRDGFEEYEYLYMLGNLAKEYGEEYQANNFTKSLDSLYESLYEGTIPKTDYNLVLKARAALASMLELANSEAHAFVSAGEINGAESKVTVEVYAQSGAELTVDGETVNGMVSGNGVKFTYTQSLTQNSNTFAATLSCGGKTYDISMFLSGKVVCISDFETQDSIDAWQITKRGNGEEHISLSLNDDPRYVKFGSSSAKITSTAKEWTIWELANYDPRITLDKSAFMPQGSFKDVDSFELYVFNATDNTFDISIELVAKAGSGERTRSLVTYTVQPGENRIRVVDVYKTVWRQGETDYMLNVTGIAIGLPLLEEDIEMYIDGFSYVYC